MSNDDIQLVAPQPADGTSTMTLGIDGNTAAFAVHQALLTWVQGPFAERSLLAGLEDPRRIVPAHVFLLQTHRIDYGTYSVVDGVARADMDGLPLRADPPEGRAEADLSNWRSIRDRWHDRLDRHVVWVDERSLAFAGCVLPLCWVINYHRELRRSRRRGYCRACGYDLTGNSSGVCPECGTAVAWKAGA